MQTHFTVNIPGHPDWVVTHGLEIGLHIFVVYPNPLVAGRRSNPSATHQYITATRSEAKMIQPDRLIYVGVDLHKQHHSAVIIDC
ncbi:hypothetical protein [Paenibacillus sp. NPDC057934]|uniref:hypothetical protein n=1 Tax=Paenibacillus sp. NPDC057934 TaxID=3346282 RepID=UPI0036DBBFE5